MEPFDRVIAALQAHGCRVQVRGRHARAVCPSHRDARPSLALDERGTTVLLKCFAGCPTRAVLAALGLTFADLGDERRPTPAGSREIVASYAYDNLLGQTLARKLRYQPKAFGWQRPDSSRPSGWRAGLDGLRPGLFGLPYAVDARRVLITEGEKAATLLHDHGLAAIAPPIGANLWQPAWTESLWRCGCVEAVVLPDADGPGRTHALRVVASLHTYRPALPEAVEGDPWPDVALQCDDPEAAPLAVKLITLPGLAPGEDVHDWLTTHGYAVADLLALIDAAPYWTPEDPTARRRRLTRERVQRYRARQRGPCNAREIRAREKVLVPRVLVPTSCRDQISHSVTRYTRRAA